MQKLLKLKVMAAMLFLMCFTFNSVRAELQDFYVVTPKYENIEPTEIKTVRTSFYYADVDDLKVLVDLTNDHGYGLPTQDFFNKILQGGKIHPVEPGNAPVIFFFEYEGWWIFKIDR